MALKRHMAAMLWAAIVLIVAQIVPTVAQAHVHHHHAVSAMAAPQAHGIKIASIDANRAATAVVTSAMWDSDAGASSVPCKDRHGCADSCCCCPALASTPPDGVLALPRVRDFNEPTAPARRGIDPEGLARPPRSFT
jgi:hypothetical protein